VEWLPGQRAPSEGDFLPDVPAERGIKMAFYIQELVQHFICNGALKLFAINKRGTVTLPAPPGADMLGKTFLQDNGTLSSSA